MAVADLIQFFFALGASHFVEEATVGINAQPDKVEEFLEVVDMVASGAIGQGGGLVEVFDVLPNMGEGGAKDFPAGEVLAELTEDPGIANAGASDHEAVAVGLIKYTDAFGDGGDVAVGEDGAGQALCGAADVRVMNFAAVGFFDGAGVEAEEVDLVFFQQVEYGFEVAVIFEADAHFDGKSAFDGLSQAAEYGVDFCRFAKEAAADVFLVYLGCGATHVEVYSGDGQ